MSQLIDEARVRHIAKLARLNLDPEQVRTFAGQLAAILEYVHALSAVDTQGVEPMAHALPVTDVLREDVPGECLTTQVALANAPQREGPFFRVPAVLD